MPRTIVARVPNKGYPEVAVHDGRLIAAAPMLLETLQFILDHGYVNGSDYDRVSKAIEEATGETP